MFSVEAKSIGKTFHARQTLWGRSKAADSQALSNVSFSACGGEAVVVLGPNGSGKTTLLKIISTMLLPDTGTILVEGVDVVGQPREAVRRIGFAVASERSFYPRLTAVENLDFFAVLDEVPKSARRSRIAHVLELTGLEATADRPVHTFSTGMYQRLGIARALLKNPSLLLLDEPSRSLDPDTAEQFWQWLRTWVRSKTTIIVATHDFEEAIAVGDVVILLKNGELAATRRISKHASVGELRDFYRSGLRGRAAKA